MDGCFRPIICTTAGWTTSTGIRSWIPDHGRHAGELAQEERAERSITVVSARAAVAPHVDPEAAHGRQRHGTIRVGDALHAPATSLSRVPHHLVHLKAGEPLHIARQIDAGLNAALPVRGLEGGPAFDDLVACLVLALNANLLVVGAGPAFAADGQIEHDSSSSPTSGLNINGGNLRVGSVCNARKPADTQNQCERTGSKSSNGMAFRRCAHWNPQLAA